MRTRTAVIIPWTRTFVFIVCTLFFSLSLRSDNDTKKTVLPYICIEGIMFNEENPLAIVNENIVGEGDTVDDVEILKIAQDSVQLRYRGVIFLREVGQDCRPATQPALKSSQGAKGSGRASIDRRVSKHKGRRSIMQAAPLVGGGLVFVIWLLMMAGMVAGYVILLLAAWRAMKAHESIAESLIGIANNFKPRM